MAASAPSEPHARATLPLAGTEPPLASRRAPLKDMLIYATGDGATSLVINTFFGFSMMYYTKALGMNVKMAGGAMAIVTLWDAIIAPLMGHITDNTRSRFGRRHPYMLIGGILTVLCFYAAWSVPEFFRTPTLLFWYVVGVTLLLRTSAAIYLVPQGALGFEICTDYTQRSTLQGVRNGLNMAVNLGATILIWSVFLTPRNDVEGTRIPANYQHMGFVLALAALAFVCIAVFGTRKYIVDSRHSLSTTDGGLGAMARSLLQTLLDPYPLRVFLFRFLLHIGVALVCSIQMFVYVDFMGLVGWQRSVVHGSTMVAALIGSLLAAPLVRRLDKKQAVYLGVIGGVLANGLLIALFYTGWVKPSLVWGAVPLAMLLFLVCNSGYHLATNVVKVTSDSMMADVSEICRLRTGVLKDGGYSAMMLFAMKMGMSIGLALCGLCMGAIGYKPDQPNAPEVICRLLPVGFLGGSLVGLIAVVFMLGYPVNRAYMAQVKSALAAGDRRDCGNETDK